MEQQGFVSFLTGPLPVGPDDDTPVLSIVLTDHGKEVVVGVDG